MTKEKTTTRGNASRKILYFALSLVAALGITVLLRDSSYTEAQTYVLFLLLFSIGLWFTEAVPAFAVGLFIIAFLAFTLGYNKIATTPQDIHIYLNTFSSSVIWLMLGGFFLASAMTKTKLDVDLIRVTMGICGTNPKWILLGMMLVTMIASLLISNTAATAMVVAALMPLVTQLGSQSPVSKWLILGIPVAATTGGMGTMIGSPPNAIAAGAMAAAGHPMDFITWILYGLPICLVLTFVAWTFIARRFKDITEISGWHQSEAAELTPELKVKRRIVVIVLVSTLIMWLTGPLHGLSPAAVSAIPLVALTLAGVLSGDDVRAMGWDTLLLVAGGISLGYGLQLCGLLDIYAAKIAGLPLPKVALYFTLAYATMLFSNVMSGTATSTVLIPLGATILPQNIVEISMIISLSASTGLFLPVSTPPNAIVFSTGLIQQKDLRRGGALIGLLGPALIVLWVLALSLVLS